jgi:hypothetical protein
MDTRNAERDWSALKGVVSVLWISAAIVLLGVQYFVPRDHDIIVDGSKPPLALAGQVAP